ncbi:HEAT repeat domain-containing protein [Iningainema tapete]|uniref:HEAT repeat domain-containing protein n=1 Tax=Iningainema tapete BLCC-T55 TaxID=2748662 RepID=A0A8J6XLL5_9CYAN|nr:HEAT repeat domain-containing protein [Iningainema tapete]MBD2777038.1 HEAT repeat domain-containing protein [Iningainema tapete BLCC-T55]
MTESYTKYQDYVDKLDSNNPDLVVEAAHTLGDLGDRRAVPILIDLLQTTTNPVIRNAAAVGLRELGDERALYPIVSLLKDPKTEGYRGTLVYALEGFDCSSVITLLVDLVITGNFEVSHQAFQVIELIDSEVNLEILDFCVQKVQDAIPKSDDDKVELLKDLVELLTEMKLSIVN